MRRPPLGSLALVAALTGAALVASAGATPGGPVPWPRGDAPSPGALDAKIDDAFELFDVERGEEFLEAYEVGEDSEHIFVMQEWIDRGELEVERLFLFGDATFEHEFRAADGYGARGSTSLFRVHDGARGGLDTFSCGGCHQQGGLNGAGNALATTHYFGDGERLDSAVVRNPPQVLGLGFVQALAYEMSNELAQQRDAALAKAKRDGKDASAALVTKGVTFGRVVAKPSGDVDYAGLEGVDDDLVVKPFGWKGHTARLRRFGERAARIHFGIQSHVLAMDYREDPDIELLGAGPFWWDPDQDGRARELEEGAVTSLAVYLALLEAPVMIPPVDPSMRERWARGSELFGRIGCSDCHRRSLPLGGHMWTEHSDTTDGKPVVLDLIKDGESPRGSRQNIQLFSDLRRHVMGEELMDAHVGPDGVDRDVFLTRPLWGLAETAPYLHDGRAPTIPDAILAHGGEAAVARSAFEALSDRQQQDIHIFLLSLTREPRLRVPR